MEMQVQGMQIAFFMAAAEVGHLLLVLSILTLNTYYFRAPRSGETISHVYNFNILDVSDCNMLDPPWSKVINLCSADYSESVVLESGDSGITDFCLGLLVVGLMVVILLRLTSSRHL